MNICEGTFGNVKQSSDEDENGLESNTPALDVWMKSKNKKKVSGRSLGKFMYKGVESI